MTARVSAGVGAGRGRAPRRPAVAAAERARQAPFAPLAFARRDRDAEQAAERIPLFEIDGTEYTIPAVVPTGDALALLAVASGLPDEARRGMYLVRELAGPDALAALLGEAEITEADWRRLLELLAQHAFGGLEGGSGN